MDDQITEEEREAVLASSTGEAHEKTLTPHKPASLGSGMNSSIGFFHKFIFPPAWIVLFGTGAWEMFLRKGRVEIVLMWLLATIMLYWFCGRLKRVSFSLSERKLYVSNFVKIIEIPFDDVEEVSGSLMLSPELIFIRFNVTTEFGRKIMFMPPLRFLVWYSEHPIAEELRVIIFRNKVTN